MDEFFRTRMGQRFFEVTMPRIAEQLERLAVAVETLNETLAGQTTVIGEQEGGVTSTSVLGPDRTYRRRRARR